MQDKLGLGCFPTVRRTLGRVSETARQLISRAEYITLERDCPIRHEWVGGVLFAMTGSSGVHNRIAGRLAARLLPVAESHGCRPYASDMRLMTPKRAAYFAIETLKHYLVVHQDQPRIEHHWRTDGDWQLEVVGPIDTITLICPPMSLSVSDLFAGLVPFET